MCGPRSSDRGARLRTPSVMVMLTFGGMMYTRPASTRMPCVASTTGIRVVLDRISVKMLGCFGSRCWTSTKPIVASTGRCDNNSENASNPPAEAPMPAIGKASFDPGGAAGPAPRGRETSGSPVALSVGDGVGGGAPWSRVAARGARGDLFLGMLSPGHVTYKSDHVAVSVERITGRSAMSSSALPVSKWVVAHLAAAAPCSNAGMGAPVPADDGQTVASGQP